MDMEANIPAVPRQHKGARSDTAYTFSASGEAQAKALFQRAKQLLLDVNNWHTTAGGGAFFQLVDAEGMEINTGVQKGNYFRITIPGVPGPAAGGGHEWVQVEKIEESENIHHTYVAIRVRPVSPPFIISGEVAHFFSREATSTFGVVRKHRRVTAFVSGRNEQPNTRTVNLLNWLRNVVVGAGAMLGLNKPQWKSLVKGIIARSKREIGNSE